MKFIFSFFTTIFFVSTALAQVAPSAQEIEKFTGLHKAAHENNVLKIEQLAKDGADLEARDASHRTPVHVAAFASNDEALVALAGLGADMNALEFGLYDAVTIAAVADDPEIMSLAIEHGNRTDQITSIYRGTALIAAAHLGHVEVVNRLIEAGAPLDHVNKLHWTALMEAVVLGNGGQNYITVVKALVQAGANTSLADREGITPLAHAESRGYKEIAAIIASQEKK